MNKKLYEIYDTIIKPAATVTIALLIGITISSHVSLQQVSGHSMDPTFHDGDYIIVTDLATPKDNDVITLDTSYITNYEEDGKHIIKRYYESKSTDGYYVLGDNSAISYDSRYYGEAPKEALEGVVLVDLSKSVRNTIATITSLF